MRIGKELGVGFGWQCVHNNFGVEDGGWVAVRVG